MLSRYCFMGFLLGELRLAPARWRLVTLYTNATEPDRHGTRPRHENSPPARCCPGDFRERASPPCSSTHALSGPPPSNCWRSPGERGVTRVVTLSAMNVDDDLDEQP